MKRNYTARRGSPRQRRGGSGPRSASSLGSKSESEDGGKKRAAPSRRVSLLGTATRMLGLSISGKEGAEQQRRHQQDQDSAQPDVWQQPASRHPGGKEAAAGGDASSAASCGSLEALAAKGWAGMPQSEGNNNDGGATVGGGVSSGPAAAVEGPAPASSPPRGRQSGSESLGGLAAMLPWLRSGGGSASNNKASQSSQGGQWSGGGGGGRFLSGFGRRSQSQSRNSASMRSASGGGGVSSASSHLLGGSVGEAPRFVHPLYNLVESNRLEPKDPTVPVTARDLNLVMEATSSYVADCMRFYYHVHDLTSTLLPTDEKPKAGTVMASHNWQTAKQLMVLVPNDLSGCPLGLWSRSLCIEQGLRFGTMLPYVDTAYREGFAVVVCHPAAAAGAASVKDDEGKDGSATAAMATAEEHVAWVYDHLLTRAQAEHVALVGYGHGAQLCKEMLLRSLSFQHPTLPAKPIATIALIEACCLKEAGDSPEVAELLAARTVNLKKSQHPIGRALPDVAAAIGVGRCFSLGTAGRDTNPAWSIYQGMGEVFKFCAPRPPEKGKKKKGGNSGKGLGIVGHLLGRQARASNAGDGKQAAAAAVGAGANPSSAATVDGSVGTQGTASVRAVGGAVAAAGGSSSGLSVARSLSGMSAGAGAAACAGAMSSNHSYASGPFAATDSVDQTDCPSTDVDTALASVHGGLRRKDSWSALLDRMECMTVDNFVLERVIGKGAFGKVMMVRVRKDPSQRVYAMKVINKAEIIRRGYLDSTKLERAILSSSEHPFIVRLRFAFQNGAKLYLVTDFYNGGNLLVHLKRNAAFPEHAARFFAGEVFLAINYLHRRNIVYRDLKPENVLMESSGHVALTDFGLSKTLLPGDRTSTFCGTAEYLAPEQLRRAPYDTSVDWWALGIFVYEMLVGRSPFYNRSRTTMYERIVHEEPAFPSEMSADAADIIALLLKKAPESRLGPEEIKAHPFFRGVDWELLYAKETAPPINPDAGRASDCRYISSRYLTLEPRDTEEGDARARFSDFTFIGDDTYQRAVGGYGRGGCGPGGWLLGGADVRDSHGSGSDATPWTSHSSSAYTTSSALTASSKGSSGNYDPATAAADPHAHAHAVAAGGGGGGRGGHSHHAMHAPLHVMPKITVHGQQQQPASTASVSSSSSSPAAAAVADGSHPPVSASAAYHQQHAAKYHDGRGGGKRGRGRRGGGGGRGAGGGGAGGDPYVQHAGMPPPLQVPMHMPMYSAPPTSAASVVSADGRSIGGDSGRSIVNSLTASWNPPPLEKGGSSTATAPGPPPSPLYGSTASVSSLASAGGGGQPAAGKPQPQPQPQPQLQRRDD